MSGQAEGPVDVTDMAGGWLEWAKHRTWQFASYYKYRFTFTFSGKVFFTPGQKEPTPFTATVSAGGDSADIYHYTVTPEMSWNEIINGGDWDLTVRTGDDPIFSTDPHLMQPTIDGEAPG